MKNLARLLSVGALAAGIAGCSDLLNVQNENNPDQRRILATPADVASLIKNSYAALFNPMYASDGLNMQLPTMAHENSAMAANFGMIERSAFPRAAIINTASNQFSGEYAEVWNEAYSAIRNASDGLIAMEGGISLGSDATNAQAKAFAKFVQGWSHGILAITYDQASIYDETIPASQVEPLVPYDQVMDAALGYIDEAISIAESTSGMPSFDASWMGTPLSPEEFVQVMHSVRARLRAQVARTPAERQALDWNAIIADVDAGITSDFEVVDDDKVFDFWMLDYMSFKGAWHQIDYHILGMADVSGAYQYWISLPVGVRHADSLRAAPGAPPIIQTPDLRFPQGSTTAEQAANPGLYIRYKGTGGWVRAERGTWRWSRYDDDRFLSYFEEGNTGLPIPVIKKSEMDLLKAEGLIYLGREAEAVPLINITRVGNGGLPAVTAAGVPVAADCVPKLPDGSCGDLMEALKWEKRLENWMTVYGGWYFDSRGWGDLAEGTPLHYPVPAGELQVRQLPLYTFGGVGGDGAAPVGSYGW
jgi:hypothetical protein